jgi:hypothetical protein
MAGTAYWGLLRDVMIRRALGASISEDSLAWLEARADAYFERAFEVADERRDRNPRAMCLAVWYTLSIKGDRDAAVEWLRRGVQFFGNERMAENWLTCGPWGSRLLAPHRWYREFLSALRLGSPSIDTLWYNAHKAHLFEGIGEQRRAVAHHDSALTQVNARMPNSAYAKAWTFAGLGQLALAAEAASLAKRRIDSANAFAYSWPLLVQGLVHARNPASHADAIGVFRRLVLWEGNRWATPNIFALDPGLAHLRGREDFEELLALY